MSEKFRKMANARYRKAMNEHNDCSVIAVAIAFRMTYKEAHTIMAAFGRRNRHRFHTRNILPIAENFGFTVEPVNNLIQKSGAQYTPKTIGNRLKKGYYLTFIRGHVFAVVNGEVHDWTNGRRHRITEAYKVTRTRGQS